MGAIRKTRNDDRKVPTLAAFALVTLAGGVSRLTAPSPKILQTVTCPDPAEGELESQSTDSTMPWDGAAGVEGISPQKDGFWARVLSVG